ncbi:MAG: cell wall metabolism sensor histidine kinase WalK [Aerococcus sp.]|nr:cell wall metabolism sensor histidine kinase WalK [Aerococcus sp.]
MRQKRQKTQIGFFNSVHFKLPLVFILMMLLTLEFVGAYFIRQLESEMLESFDRQVSDQLVFLEDSVRPLLQSDNKETNDERMTQLNGTLRRFDMNNVIEAQVLDESGSLLATSSPTNQGNIGQHATDTVIEQALYSGTQVKREIYDPNQNIRLKKYAVPMFSELNSGIVNGLIVLTVNIESVYDQVQSIVVIFITSSLLAMVLTLTLIFFVARGITRPLQEEADQIEQIAEGNYSGQVPVYSEDEIGHLARSINYLSRRVKEAQDSTESERQRLDSVLRHMSDGVIATNRRNRVMLMNDRALELINKSEEEVMGRSILDVLNLKEKYTFRDLMSSDGEVLMDFDTDDGNYSVIKGEFSVIQRDSGFVSGVVWVLTDVTEREKIEAEQREFVSNVSHELRTPLTSVSSYTEALLDGALDDPKVSHEFLDVIQTETHRMIRMINDLLSLSRMDDHREKINLELLDFNQLVNHILDRFDMIIDSDAYRNVSFALKRELNEESYWVEVDQDRMTQVIDNILNNALKYSPDGGTITVRLMSTHNQLILSVQDQGLGMSQKDIPNVFDRFYRVDKARSRAQGGTGLGLSIAKEVVELHGGSMWVNSIENKGSTFFISLPYDASLWEDDWEI